MDPAPFSKLKGKVLAFGVPGVFYYRQTPPFIDVVAEKSEKYAGYKGQSCSYGKNHKKFQRSVFEYLFAELIIVYGGGRAVYFNKGVVEKGHHKSADQTEGGREGAGNVALAVKEPVRSQEKCRPVPVGAIFSAIFKPCELGDIPLCVYCHRKSNGLCLFTVDVGLRLYPAQRIKAVISVKGALPEGIEFLSVVSVFVGIYRREDVSAVGTGVIDRRNNVTALWAYSADGGAVGTAFIGALVIRILTVRILVVWILTVRISVIGILTEASERGEALLILSLLVFFVSFRLGGFGRFSPLAFGAVELLIGAVTDLIVAFPVMGSSAHGTNDNVVVILEFHLTHGAAKSRISAFYDNHLLNKKQCFILMEGDCTLRG